MHYYIFYRLKTHSDTRWSSMFLKIKNMIALHEEPGLIEEMKNILGDQQKKETKKSKKSKKIKKGKLIN